MIDIKVLRDNPEEAKKKLASRGLEVDVERILKIDEERRELIKKSDELRALKNDASKKIGAAAPEERKKLIEDVKVFDVEAEKIEKKRSEVEAEFDTMMRELPNLPLNDVKVGRNSDDNEELRKIGTPPAFDFEPKDHLSLGEQHKIIDTERAGKVSGSRFGYLLGEAAMLEFALIQYTMQTLVRGGFTPVVPPVMIKRESMQAMGFLEHGGNQEIYHLQDDDMFLVGTSEQSIGPYHMNEILDAKELPIRYAGFSSCFRRESGTYGKDTRGILRVHQFDKIEMFSYTTPELSNTEHDYLLSMQEKLVAGLKLPYRVLKLCSGDMGRPSARTYDIETWIPSQKVYRETHSTSTCTDYQARRLNVRYRDAEGKVQLVHTLNGTAFAIGRIIIAILENNQRADGSIAIPDVLQPLMMGKQVIGG